MAISGFAKLKKSRLGAPPTDENPQIAAEADAPAVFEPAESLQALPAPVAAMEQPERAPAHSVAPRKPARVAKLAPARHPAPAKPPQIDRIDGRTLRRTGRTLQFATKVTPEFDLRVRQIAQREGRLIVEVLEAALDSYEKAKR